MYLTIQLHLIQQKVEIITDTVILKACFVIKSLYYVYQVDSLIRHSTKYLINSDDSWTYKSCLYVVFILIKLI